MRSTLKHIRYFQHLFPRRPGDDERDSRGAEPPGDGELHELRDAQVRGRGARAVPALRHLPADNAKPLHEVSAPFRDGKWRSQ